jgi:hypothetical protein
MKNVLILSEAIYKGQHKLVNQGAFINFSDLINDIFACDGLTCACNGNRLQKSDIFIRKAYLIYSRKKPGANWTSLEKIVKDVYNCCAGTSLCPSKKEQWWITTDVIRPAKTIETINFTNIIIKVLTCCEILNCCGPVIPPVSPFFDVTALDWSVLGITNQSDFENYLTALGATSVSISSFSLTGNRLEATMVVTGLTTLDLQYSDITAVDKIGGFDNSLTTINLNNNLLTTFNPSIALPTSLTYLELASNNIVTFNPSIALPTSLAYLGLNNNQIVTFNPALPLPSSLINLDLGNNQIVTFNPTFPLPSTLDFLDLSSNDIVIFNPTHPLPTSLNSLSLAVNQMTTAGYTASEPWANAQPAFSSTCNINMLGNVNSVSGTNLRAILVTKNCNIAPL